MWRKTVEYKISFSFKLSLSLNKNDKSKKKIFLESQVLLQSAFL